MKIAVFAIAALLSGCVTASAIQPVGNGLYSITADSRALGAKVADTRSRVLSQANAFCAEKKLSMVADHFDDHMGINSAASSLTFRCQ